MQIDEIKTPVITTLSVEVKALRIGKKQCTISVFKQIPEINIYTEDRHSHRTYYDLDWSDEWIIWGNVRYKGDIWAIIQSQDTLFRAKANFPKWRFDAKYWESHIDYDDRFKTAEEAKLAFNEFMRKIHNSDQLFIAV